MSRKDPSKAEIGPLASGPGEWLSDNDPHLPKGTVGYVPDEYDDTDEGVEKEAAAGRPERRQVPGDYKPTRPVPDMNEGHDPPTDREVDLNTHSAPDNESLISDRIKNLQNGRSEKQIQETGDVVREQVEEQEEEREAFIDRPTDITINRTQLDDRQSNASDYPIDSNSASLPVKTASDPLAILAEDEANPVLIMATLNNEWGEDEWYDWEPETIIEMASRSNVDISRGNMDKVMALKVLRKRDDFWEKPRVFAKVCISFASRMVDWSHIQEPRVHEIAATIAMVERYIRERAFSEAVETYVAASAVRDGFIMMPPTLQFASFAFSEQLIESMGDEAMDRQSKLMGALENESPGNLEADDVIQYMRLLRCQQHVHHKINEVRA